MIHSFGMRFNFADGILEELVRYAVMNGFKRENPEKAWTPLERRRAARWAIDDLVNDYLARSP